ncbi:hypothetical protein [Longimicrobium sp.]|uniref:hypothetical protein n=1 Tax=Longimicrobium sp. TaxID=2029185 RepID=UPI002ED980DF
MRMRLLLAAALAAAALPGRAAAQERAAPGALILSPEPGERVPADQVLVAVSLPREADSLAVSVRIGSRDVSAEVERSGGVVTWRPREPLAPGPHRVVVAARGGGAPVEWTFTVAPGARLAGPTGVPRPRPSPALPHGSIVMEGGGNSVSGPGGAFRRENDFAPRMWVNAGGQLRPGWRYSVRGHLSGYETATRQPVNRLRADLHIPGLSLAVGDVNPVLHDVILSGRRVRGGQLDLRAGFAGLSVVAGQTVRAIPGALDPLDPTRIERRGTYEQDLLAVRPSLRLGGFRMGLTVMHARDDVGSIPTLRTSSSAADSGTFSAIPAPRDNLVAGLDVSLRLARDRIVLQYENAASLLARDITFRPRTQRELDSLFVAAGADPPGLDPASWDRFFILNASLLPLDPRGLTSTAHQARASVRAGGHLFSAEWRSVGMDYQTMGHPGLQRDWRGLRVRDSFSLLDALFVTAGYEQDRDNLDGSAPATRRGQGGFASVTWQAPRDLLLTGSLRLATRGNGLAAGTPGALDESTLAASGGVLVPVGRLAAFRTRVSLNGTWVERSDPANPLSETRDLYVLAGVQGETESRGTSFSLMAGQNRAEFPGLADGSTTFDRLTAYARRQLTERWAARFDGGITAARSPDAAGAAGPRYTRGEALGGGEFAWRPDALLSFTAGVVDYTDQRIPGLDTRELVMRIRLSRAF